MERPIANGRVGSRVAPGGVEGVLQRRRQGCKGGLVVGEGVVFRGRVGPPPILPHRGGRGRVDLVDHVRLLIFGERPIPLGGGGMGWGGGVHLFTGVAGAAALHCDAVTGRSADIPPLIVPHGGGRGRVDLVDHVRLLIFGECPLPHGGGRRGGGIVGRMPFMTGGQRVPLPPRGGGLGGGGVQPFTGVAGVAVRRCDAVTCCGPDTPPPIRPHEGGRGGGGIVGRMPFMTGGQRGPLPPCGGGLGWGGACAGHGTRKAAGKIIARVRMVAVAVQMAQHSFRRGNRIQPDRMGQIVRAARIGGQDQRQFAVGAGGGGKAVPAGDTVHNGGDPGGIRAMAELGKLGVGVALAGGFETGDACENAAVHFGQGDVHGEVGRGQAAF